MKKISVLSIIFILLISFLNVFPAYPADNSSPEKITDISDRKYEQALIDLLDNAKESIVVSMYGISPGAGEKSPVMLLLNDLLEARKRGVSVTMYLNTRFRDTDKSEKSLAMTRFVETLPRAELLQKWRKRLDNFSLLCYFT